MNAARWTRAGVGLWVVWASGCASHADRDADDTPHAVVDVQIDSVRVATVAAEVQLAGTTQALRQETVGAPIPGRVAAFQVLEGDAVQAAQVVARIETEESAAALRGAERLLDDATGDAARSRAQDELARARAARTWVDVRAPFDGVVSVRHLHEGEWSAAGAPILTVVDLHSLVFVGRAPAPVLARLRTGQEAGLRFPGVPDRSYRARVEAIAPALDPESQTAAVRCRILDGDAGLRADLFGSAAVVVDVRRDAACVPARALRRDDETGACDVVEAVGDSLAVVRAVQTGVESGGLVEITGGAVRPGMHVLVVGAHGLPDSTRIRAVAADAAP
jgi:multidrug efflux pump subunit AcrA (membrane-fusion protein)